MSNDFILSLDLGTSFIKSFVVDTELEIIREQSHEIKTTFNQEIHEQDPHKILSIVKHLLDDEIRGGKMNKVTFTNAMHTTLLLNKDKEPLTSSIIWSDMRASAVYQDFIKKIDPITFYEITQVPLHPILPILKSFWFKKNNLNLWDKVEYIVSLKDWILYNLTGELITDTSTAASTGFMNFSKSTWDDQLLDICEIQNHQLPQIYEGSHKVNYLDTSMVIGITDGPMANYFVNTNKQLSQSLVATAGTSAAVRVTRKSPEKLSANSGVFTYKIDDHAFVSGIASNNAGSVLKWSDKNLNFKYLNHPPRNPPLKSEPLFNPFIYEERAPLWGVNQSHEDIKSIQTLHADKITLLVYESIFFNMLRMIESLKLKSNTNEIVISGGVFRNMEIVQLLADVIQRKVITLHSSQLSALGSARFGLEQFGFTFEKLDLDLKVVYPNKIWEDVEKERYNQFKEMIK